MSLKVGQLIRHDGRIARVAMVNASRARIAWVGGVIVTSPNNGRSFQSYGNEVNISPNSHVETVEESTLSPGELARVYRLIEQEKQMAVASAPGVAEGTKALTLKEKNEIRKAEMAAKKAEAKVEREANKKEKKAKTQNPCKCGCGTLTGGFFVPGHDARFKSWLLQIERGQKKPEDLLTAEVRGSYTWKKSGKGLIPTKNYKGEAHTGYDSASA